MSLFRVTASIARFVIVLAKKLRAAKEKGRDILPGLS
jgi:hypothetical protein